MTVSISSGGTRVQQVGQMADLLEPSARAAPRPARPPPLPPGAFEDSVPKSVRAGRLRK